LSAKNDSFLRLYLLAERDAAAGDGDSSGTGLSAAVAELCADPSSASLDRIMLRWYRQSRTGRDAAGAETVSLRSVKSLARCFESSVPSEEPSTKSGEVCTVESPSVQTRVGPGPTLLDPLLLTSVPSAAGPCATRESLAVLDPVLLLTLVEAVAADCTADEELSVVERRRCYLLLALRQLFYLFPEHFENIVRWLGEHERQPRQIEVADDEPAVPVSTEKAVCEARTAKSALLDPKSVRSMGAVPAPVFTPVLATPHGLNHPHLDEDDDIFGLSSHLLQETRSDPVYAFVPDRYGRYARNLSRTTVEDGQGRLWQPLRKAAGGAEEVVFRPLPGGGDQTYTPDTDSDTSDGPDDDVYGIFRDVGGSGMGSEAVTPKGISEEDHAVMEAAGRTEGHGFTPASEFTAQRVQMALRPLLTQPRDDEPFPGRSELMGLCMSMAENIGTMLAEAGEESVDLSQTHHDCLYRLLVVQAQCPVQAVAYLCRARLYRDAAQLTTHLCEVANNIVARDNTASEQVSPTPRFAPLRKARSMEGLEGTSDWQVLVGYVAATTESLVEAGLTALATKLCNPEHPKALTAGQVCILEAVVALKLTVKCLLARTDAMDVVAKIDALLRARPKELSAEAVRGWITVYSTAAEQRRQLLCSDIFIP
jgi:hypothetical protein